MSLKKYFNWMLPITIAGTLFSGYLSLTKLITGTCALKEPCPYFLGYPACIFGFGMFTSMLIVTIIGFAMRTDKKWPAVVNTIISTLGILFAGYFVVLEILSILAKNAIKYTLGLPTCAYGLIFYVIIFVLSITALRKKHTF